MRKFILFMSVIAVLVAGAIFYLNEEKKHFIENLLQSPAAVNQSINKSSSSGNEMEGSNAFVEGGRVVKVDHEAFPQEQTAAVEKTSSETPSPDETANFFRDQWIEMFGDIPEVHDASEYMRKIHEEERQMPIDEVIAGLEGLHYLFPNGGHGILLKMRKSQKAQGIDEVEFMYDEELENERYAPDHKVIYLNSPEPFPSYPPASDSISSESIDEDIDVLPVRSEGTPVMPESKTSVTSEHVHHKDEHRHEGTTLKTPVPAAAKDVEADGWEGLSLRQREQAKQLFDQFGTEEGLRHLRESDPEMARQFESDKSRPGREHRPAPSRNAPDGEQSESGSKD